MLRASWTESLQKELMRIQREHVLPKLVAEDIIKVQPMTIPEDYIPYTKLKVEKTQIVARERKLKPGWRMEMKENGDFTMWYEEPEKDFLEDIDVLV